MEEEYKIAFSEVYDILKYSDENITQKIPKKFLKFIEDSKDELYKSKVVPYIPFEKQNVTEETKCIMAILFREYLATDEQKKEYEELDLKREIEEEKIKREKYNYDNIFENKENILTQEKTLKIEENTLEIDENNDIEKSLVDSSKTNIFSKIINFLKGLFKKNK